MHKQLFMLQLKMGLLSLPESERNEILAEYDAHFEFSKQQGRTEEEIARELGDPEELAAELLLGERGDKEVEREPVTEPFIHSQQGQASQVPPLFEDPSFLKNAEHPLDLNQHYGEPNRYSQEYGGIPNTAYPPYQQSEGRRPRSAIAYAGTIFISIMVVPVMFGLWATWFGLGVAAIALLATPLLYVLKFSLGGGAFYGTEMSIVAIAFGIGIFLIQAIVAVGRAYLKWNRIYFHWVAYEGRSEVR
ncbi:DUF1700 domain-containing protein [Paenibacillus sp. NAIST15-1]|uniref:DUF1700 domain-containing protein n=1 Tax=Paenibacillus sp. NAIST15-1 TaxID=1605994 RepID=UPI00093216CC|nr:DUF1700 domain-containing protein [Paenibacillus sp. NAIST15-1]